MINRRRFVHTLTAAGIGAVTADCFAASSEPRRRAVNRGADVLRSADGRLNVTLHAAETNVTVGGRRARLFAYDGRVPAPRIEVRPGDEISLRLENQLSESTNLHFHGLHIPPSGSSDNIFLHITPGQTFDYRFTIPSSHPAGLFWIHPHMHGSVARQVSRGLAAPLVIRGEIDQIPEVAAAAEHVLVLQDFALDAAGIPLEPSMPELTHGREGALITLNGQSAPLIGVEGGGLLRLRLVNASSSRFYRLALEQHPLHIIGVDGGALSAVRSVDEILFVPGQRLDILVHATRGTGRYRLLSLPYDRGSAEMMGGMGGGSGASETLTLATVEYRGQSSRTWILPQRLVTAPALSAANAPPRTIQLGQGMGMGRGMSFLINGRTFDENRIDAAPRLGSIEEWEYVNPTGMDHPMHLHTNPFQIVQPDGSLEGAWRDIALVKAGARTRIRVSFEDFTGKTVQHCHILDHEDLGMMATVEMRA
ncbi:MAG: multicopper oxidase family protein [Thermoanaerobaculia bacterium]|nr:multicopper oxidase family protein [Thermoanaerobaculia bacterium]